MLKKILKEQSGMSLIEVIIAAAIAVAIALGVAKMGQNANKSMTKIKTDTELGDLKNYMKTILTRSNNCRNTFRDPGLDMKDPNVLTTTDLTLVPPIATATAYYEISSSGYASSFDFVRNSDPALGGATAAGGRLTLTADAPIPGYPNWLLKEARLYQIADAVDDTGLCSMLFKVERKAGLNSKRTFGAKEVNFWITLSCTLDPITDAAAVPPLVEKQMAYCIENQAVVPGFWTLDTAGSPLLGIRYDHDIYVGKHVIIESDERIKKDINVIKKASDKLSQIDGFYYFLKRDDLPDRRKNKKRQIGFIAQQLEKSFPEAVNTNEKTGLKSVRYSMIVPVLVQAHKEQEEKLKKQAKQIKAMNRKLNLLLRSSK